MILWNLKVREKETDQIIQDRYENDPGVYGAILDGNYKWFDVSITAISIE